MEMPESPPARMILLLETEVPFADEGRVIAGLPQQSRKRYRSGVEFSPAVVQMGADNSGHANAIGKAAGRAPSTTATWAASLPDIGLT